ncbi:MAG: HAMP domain-containing histidine kinase [Oscillospiraceae bacterium]|nr:HAMP domain-containing histidine kinase [Oscillospiraceae bacterium]
MSAKLRLTLWFTLMVFILAAMVLVFVLVINSAAITDDPAERLVKTVLRNADDVEFDNGRFDWEELEPYRRGVYCSFYNTAGELLLAAEDPGMTALSLPFEKNIIRTVNIGGQDYFCYDSYVDMDITGIWIRGLVSSSDRSGLMHTIIVLTCTLLPALMALTLGGGWIIALDAFRPMEKILAAADSISDGGDLTARVGLKRGPTEMRRLSRAFDRMFARLELSFNAERQFASDASHELRTPITVILAECDRAKRKDKSPEDFLASIAVIEEQGKHMSELVQQLLGLTRMQHGTDRYPMRRSDLSIFVESCCGEFMPHDSRGISLETDIKPGIEADFNPALMSRVVQNLLQNAYKYGRENGHILVSLEQRGGRALLRVRDDGIGIAPEDQDKIWQRFWQADTSRGEDGGSGLGLAMVKEIAEFHGGRASVDSEPGKGSTFMVEI